LATRKSQYWSFLEDPNFRRWYDNLARGSFLTAKERLRRLGLLHKQFGVHPNDLAKMSAMEARGWILDVVTKLEQNGMKANYIDNHVKAVKSWRYTGGSASA